MAADKKAEKKPAIQKFGDDRKKALEVALGKIEKDFGKGSVMKLGTAASNMQVEVIPTGSLQLDFALGVGGLPKGRIVEIYGPESSGKTTVALHCVAQAQKAGGTAAFIDAEHALDPVYASKLGVDIDELYVSQPDNGEQALDICEALVRSGAIDIVVVDSVAALVPKAEIEGDMGDSHVGLQARLMSQALRKLTGVISKTNAVVIFINQLREKVGVMYGNPETTTGGKALKFYASVRAWWTCCTARASAARASCWTSPWSRTWCRSRAPFTPTRASASARAGTTPASSSMTTRRPSTRWRRRSARASVPAASRRRWRRPRFPWRTTRTTATRSLNWTSKKWEYGVPHSGGGRLAVPASFLAWPPGGEPGWLWARDCRPGDHFAVTIMSFDNAVP